MLIFRDEGPVREDGPSSQGGDGGTTKTISGHPAVSEPGHRAVPGGRGAVVAVPRGPSRRLPAHARRRADFPHRPGGDRAPGRNPRPGPGPGAPGGARPGSALSAGAAQHRGAPGRLRAGGVRQRHPQPAGSSGGAAPGVARAESGHRAGRAGRVRPVR
ncbi:MAG TPA: hypothetical protein DCG45_13830 [Alcanivorax sp.]|nr:hypothetical protein [Alcanivorax sp.]